MRIIVRLVGFLRPYKWRVALAVLLGVFTVASNVGLLATAAYVISAAAIVPYLFMLVIPVYLVRLFSVSRAASRYAVSGCSFRPDTSPASRSPSTNPSPSLRWRGSSRRRGRRA